MLYDWSTITALLLRESDELISSALRPSQAAVLLHMFVCSARDIHRKHVDGNDASGNWESLNAVLQQSLSSLLQRFRDDESNLDALAGLLELCDYSLVANAAGATAVSGSSNQKNFKGLLKIVQDLLSSVQSDSLVVKLVGALYSWRTTLQSGPLFAAAGAAVSAVLNTAWEAVALPFASIRTRNDDTPGKSSKRNSKGGSNKVVFLSALSRLVALCVGVCRRTPSHGCRCPGRWCVSSSSATSSTRQTWTRIS